MSTIIFIMLILTNGIGVYSLLKLMHIKKMEKKIIEKKPRHYSMINEKKIRTPLVIGGINILNITVNGLDVVYIILINLCIVYLYWMKKNIRTEKIDKGIIKDVYRMQRYICHQYFSGSRIEDGLKEVYKLAECPQLYDTFLNLSITLTQTSSVEQSMRCLKKFEQDAEVRLLIQSIEMMQQSSNHKLSLEKMNHLLYKKYYYYLEKEVEKCKFNGTLLVTLYGILIVIILGVPLIMEAIEASAEIFI